jgi:hypothetical protein
VPNLLGTGATLPFAAVGPKESTVCSPRVGERESKHFRRTDPATVVIVFAGTAQKVEASGHVTDVNGGNKSFVYLYLYAW